jgi:hypothetical protein
LKNCSQAKGKSVNLIQRRLNKYKQNLTERQLEEVTDPNNGSNQEKYLEVGKRASEDIDVYLSEGKTLLKIQRFGLGKDTRYHVTSA